MSLSLDVVPSDVEKERGRDMTLTCVVSGISQQLDSVVWKLQATPVTDLSSTTYTVTEGIYDGSTNSQTSILVVSAIGNTVDSVYKCVITSDEWLQTDYETVITQRIFGMF